MSEKEHFFEGLVEKLGEKEPPVDLICWLGFRCALRILPLARKSLQSNSMSSSSTTSFDVSAAKNFSALEALSWLIECELFLRSPGYKVGSVENKKGSRGALLSLSFTALNSLRAARSGDPLSAMGHLKTAISFYQDAADFADEKSLSDVLRSAIDSDLSQPDYRWSPIWQTVPTVMDISWREFKDSSLADHSAPFPFGGPDETNDWRFWIDWYESHLNGQPLPVALLREVASTPSALWVGTPTELNAHVMSTYNSFLARREAEEGAARSPLSLEPFAVKTDDGRKLDAAPRETPNLSDVIDDINRALERFTVACNDPSRGGNTGPIFCGYLTFNVEELQDDLDHYSAVPGKILQALQVFTETVEDIAANSEVTTPRPFATLLARIKSAQTEIARLSPSVHEEDRARFRIMVELTNRDHLRRQYDILATLPNDTHGLLHAEVTRCLAVVQDPESGDREFAHASYLLRALPPTLALFIEDQDKEEGAPSPLDRLSKVAKVSEDADKLVDIGQEAVEEWGPWLSQYWLELLTKGAG